MPHPVAHLHESGNALLDPTQGLARITEATSTTLEAGSKPGRFLIKIIDEGEGSSAIYPAEALQLAATDRIFPRGTHCYIDHAAAIRRGPNGERSVRDLVAVLAEDARYDPTLKALVAEVDVFGAGDMDAERLATIKDHIGLSISASAIMAPPVDGGTKPIVARFVNAESVDFVTHAGRGGAILAVLESCAGTTEALASDLRERVERAVAATYGTDSTWLRDHDPDQQVAIFWSEDLLWSQPYTVADDTITLTGTRTQVRQVTTYVPVQSGGADTTETLKGEPMPEITQAELDRLTALDGQFTDMQKRAEAAEAKVAEAEAERKLAADQADARAKVAEAVKGEHEIVADTVTDTINAVIESGVPADLDARIRTAIDTVKGRLAKLGESSLTGFGASTDTPATPTRTHNAWGQPINTKEA